MVTFRQIELAEQLFEIEPASTYAERGGEVVAQMVGATAHRIVLNGEELPPRPDEASGEPLSIAICHGQSELGALHLWLGDVPREEAERVATWGARLLARGLAVANRFGPRRRELDVQAFLATTPLTRRERDVVGRLVSGHSTREIAGSTGLTIATVNTYLKRIFSKLGVHSRVELLAHIAGTTNAIAIASSARQAAVS